MTLTIDKAGRIIIPKAVREKLHLKAGDALELENEGDQITLRPNRPKALLKKEQGIWVFQGEPTAEPISTLIDRDREKRIRNLAG
jgi:AbrB family looped-hinge helix DNA binding protein